MYSNVLRRLKSDTLINIMIILLYTVVKMAQTYDSAVKLTLVFKNRMYLL